MPRCGGGARYAGFPGRPVRLRALPAPHGTYFVQGLIDHFFLDVEDRVRAVLQPASRAGAALAPAQNARPYTRPSAYYKVANPLDRRGRVRYGAAVLVVVLLVVVLSAVGVITAERLSAVVVGVTVVATVALFAVILTSNKISADESVYQVNGSQTGTCPDDNGKNYDVVLKEGTFTKEDIEEHKQWVWGMLEDSFSKSKDYQPTSKEWKKG